MKRMKSVLFSFMAIALLANCDSSETENRHIKKEAVSSEIEKKCKIEYLTESSYSSKIPNKLYAFIDESTAGLFFLSETTSSSFVNKFSLSPRIKQYKNVYGNDRDAYAQGNWIRASGGEYILVGNGLGNIENYFSPSGFPRNIFIYQYLDDKYYPKDVYRAIREKLDLPNLEFCDSYGIHGFGNYDYCGDGNAVPAPAYKKNGRYFRFSGRIYSLKGSSNSPTPNTLIRYKLSELNGDVKKYKQCKKSFKKGRQLEL